MSRPIQSIFLHGNKGNETEAGRWEVGCACLGIAVDSGAEAGLLEAGVALDPPELRLLRHAAPARRHALPWWGGRATRQEVEGTTETANRITYSPRKTAEGKAPPEAVCGLCCTFFFPFFFLPSPCGFWSKNWPSARASAWSTGS